MRLIAFKQVGDTGYLDGLNCTLKNYMNALLREESRSTRSFQLNGRSYNTRRYKNIMVLIISMGKYVLTLTWNNLIVVGISEQC